MHKIIDYRKLAIYLWPWYKKVNVNIKGEHRLMTLKKIEQMFPTALTGYKLIALY